MMREITYRMNVRSWTCFDVVVTGDDEEAMDEEALGRAKKLGERMVDGVCTTNWEGADSEVFVNADWPVSVEITQTDEAR